MAYIDVFKKQTKLITQLGEGNAHLVWVIGMLLQESDLQALTSEALTDGPNDKKIDFIYFDPDEGRIILAQGYYAQTLKDTAPDNKASDLNTATAWLFSGDLSTVPSELRDAIGACRDAIEKDEINSINVFYVHNLPESINVARELQTVNSHLKDFLKDKLSITLTVRELGKSQIQNLFESQKSHIAITDEITCPSKIAFIESGEEWDAGIFSVSGAWLHDLFSKYGDSLFSANYRSFLGCSRRRKINTAIRNTAEIAPNDFWVYNNGITLVTLGFTEGRDDTRLTGISIVNGAQTTGAIGSVDISKYDIRNLHVLCRVIRCQNPEKIGNIVRYNNTQNEITTWDQYSGDPEQERIQAEFKELGYSYQRKRSFEPTNDSINIEDVAQPLAAFSGRYAEANRGRNRIFENNTVYKAAFDGKKARHILFVYSLARTIDARRIELKEKYSQGTLIALEEQQLALLRNLRFKFFFLSILARSLEPIMGRPVDIKTVAYLPKTAISSESSFTSLVATALPVINSILTLLCTEVNSGNLPEIMAQENIVASLASKISAMMYAANIHQQFTNWANMLSDS